MLAGTAPVEGLEDRFHESFLVAVPPPRLRAVLEQLAAERTGASSNPELGEDGAATFLLHGSRPIEAVVQVAAEPPHQITGLRFRPPVAPTLTAAVKDAAAWFMDVLAGVVPLPSEDSITKRLAPAFLAAVPPATVLEVMKSAADDKAGRSARRVEVDGADGNFLLGDGGPGSLLGSLSVEALPPHRIAGLLFSEVPDDAVRVADLARHRHRASTLAPEVAAAIGAAVDRLAEQSGAPGVVAGVVLRGDVVHVEGVGEAWLGAGVAPTASTPFRVGSVSKPVTALAVLRQVRAGTMDLGAPLDAYLDAVVVRPVNGSQQPTLRHLLTHTAGLARDLEPASRNETRPLEEVLADGVEAVAPVGGSPSYSNVGFGLLGLALEAITGRSYQDLAADEVAGLTAPGGPPPSPPAAVGYEIRLGIVTAAEPQLVPERSAGAVVASVEQLLVLGQRLIDETELWDSAEPAATRGLGVALGDLDGMRTVWHNGGLSGWKAMLLTVPDAQLVVAVVMNTHAASEDTASQIARIVLAPTA